MFAQNGGGVVVSDQVLHYLLQQLGVAHAAFPGRQLGSSGVGQVILFKEPLLNGVRGSVPALFGLDGSNGACHRCQFRNCLVSKKLLGGKLQTGFVGFSYNLDAEDRIPT